MTTTNPTASPNPGPANAQVAGKGRSTFELACVEKRLVIEGESQRIAAFFWNRLWLPNDKRIAMIFRRQFHKRRLFFSTRFFFGEYESTRY